MDIKKILILFIIAFPKLVFASSYYGKYFPSNEECIESDICKVESVKKYNTYSFNYIDMGYLEDNNDYIKDEKDYIEDSLDEYITIDSNINEIDKVSFIYLPISLKIYELEIYYKEEKLNYTPRINYYVQFPENLYDNNLDTYYIHGNYQSFFILYLDKKYKLTDITIKIYTRSQNNTKLSLDLYNNIILNNDIDRWHIISFTNNNTNEAKYTYNKKIKYKYYNIEKIVENHYMETDNNIILDDYIIENKYYKRNKLLLEDEIKIIDANYNIFDYILFATDKVDYDCNINIDLNGTYECIFTLNDISVNKEITVDIYKDNINAYKSDELLGYDYKGYILDNISDLNIAKKYYLQKLEDNKNHNYINSIEENTILDDEKLSNKFNNYFIEEKNYINKEKTKIKLINIIKIIIGLILIAIDIILLFKKKKR